jgi:beta-glucosidase
MIKVVATAKNKYGAIMVLGANAGDGPLVANYHGMSGNMVTFAEGITAAAGGHCCSGMTRK